jgi:hypothetical protein
MRQKSPRPVTTRFSGSLSMAATEAIAVGLASARALDECVAADQPAAYESRWLAASGDTAELPNRCCGCGRTAQQPG